MNLLALWSPTEFLTSFLIVYTCLFFVWNMTISPLTSSETPSICFFLLCFYCTVSGFYLKPIHDYQFSLPSFLKHMHNTLVCTHCMPIPRKTSWWQWTLKFSYIPPLHLSSLYFLLLQITMEKNQLYDIFSASSSLMLFPSLVSMPECSSSPG